MQGLLGLITAVNPQGEANGLQRVEISFKGTCVLPQRNALPEWLKDQTLKITREVVDLREVGHAGDTLMLTPDESARWLAPLAVTPVSYGAIPATLALALRWWKDEKPPEVTVRANGRQWNGAWTPADDGFTATVQTGSFFPATAQLPVTFDITCDKLHLTHVVLPADRPCAQPVLDTGGEFVRATNAWYEIDITAKARGGGIRALTERGRGNNHFRVPENLTQVPMDNAGHTDHLFVGWPQKLGEVSLACTGIRREGAATHLLLEGVVDEGMNIRTAMHYTLFDELPLLLLQREYVLHAGKKPDKPADGGEKPKEPIDDVQSVGMGFRSAWMPERDGQRGSRILCVEGDRLAPVRQVRQNTILHQSGWWMTDGWAMVEHPQRREYMLYLFDGATPPHLATWSGSHTMTLEPFWPHVPVRPGQSRGYALALTAGEKGGADVNGGWVACRAPRADGGVRCAVIGTFRSLADATAQATLGARTLQAPLQQWLLPGVGKVWCATLDFPEGQLGDDFDMTVGGIGSRR